MPGKKNSVNGSWLGNYYYSYSHQPFGFEAVFMEVNGSVEGSILDDDRHGEARIFGTFSDPQLRFTKKYKNSALTAIAYEGTMSEEEKKIAGTWTISGGKQAAEQGSWLAWRQEEEEIPAMNTEDEKPEVRELEYEREKVRIRPRTQPQRERERERPLDRP